MKEIELPRGMTTTIDDEDYERVSQYNWQICLNDGRQGHVQGCVGGKPVFLSRFLLGVVDSNLEVGYINGDTLDNRKSNLAVMTHQVIIAKQRKRKGTSSQYKGVSWDKLNNKWRASIKAGGKNRNLGRFESEADAARAYDAAARESFGALMRLNFPDTPTNYVDHSLLPVRSGTRRARGRIYTSQFKGVSLTKNGWLATFRMHGQKFQCKFDTEMEAAQFYDEMILKHLGSNARSNFESIWAWKRRQNANRNQHEPATVGF